MATVTSRQNQIIKHIKKLHDRRYRDLCGEIIVEGVKTVKDFANKADIKYIVVTEGKEEELTSLVDTEKLLVYTVNDDLMKYISSTETPYGFLLICKKPTKEFVITEGNALLLDHVSDPGNLGTILRTAKAFGFNDIYLYGCVDVYSPKVIRAALGTVFDLNVYNIDIDDVQDLIQHKKAYGLDLVGENIKTIQLVKPVLFVLGSESQGISKEVRNMVHSYLTIPMNHEVESLNVAIAGCIAMYSLEA